MSMLKPGIEFDCTCSDGLLTLQDEPFRRKAFSIRGGNGKPRALVLSLLVHVSIGAALCFQFVPQQFMRISGSGTEQKTLEVVLVSEPPRGNAGSREPEQTTAAPVRAMPAAEPAPAVASVSKPRPVALKKKKPAAARQPLPAPAPAHLPDGRNSDGTAVSDTEPSRASDGAGTDARDGLRGPGSGGGSGGPHDTSFGQADAPRFIDYIQPKYPLAARQQGKEGIIVLRLTIDEKGHLVQVEVISATSDGFAAAAVQAVKRSTFSPAQRNGRAVAARALLPVRFALRH